MQSANLEVAARRVVYYKNINGGQVCITPNHVMVHHKVGVLMRCSSTFVGIFAMGQPLTLVCLCARVCAR